MNGPFVGAAIAILAFAMIGPARADGLTATPASVKNATLAAARPGPQSPPGVSPEVHVENGSYYLWTSRAAVRAASGCATPPRAT